MILRLVCIWLGFYSLLSSLMHGTMNLLFFSYLVFFNAHKIPITPFFILHKWILHEQTHKVIQFKHLHPN
jgi:hypothetical protein